MREGQPPPTVLARDSEMPSLVPVPIAPETKRGRRIALSVALLGTFVAAAYVASPLWVGMAFGTVMAFTFQRPYREMCHRLGGRPALSSLTMTVLAGVLCVGIGALAVYVLTEEMLVAVGYLQVRLGAGRLLGGRESEVLRQLGADPGQVAQFVHDELQKASTYAAGAASTILQATSDAIIGLIIALVTMFYVLMDWPKIAVRLERVLPLDPGHTRALTFEIRDVGRSAFVGTVLTAIIQGVFAGVGYAALGIPRPASWATVTALASLLPVVGSALVWAPASVWLLMDGHPFRGILLATWGILGITSLVDYVIRPRIVGSANHSHPLLTLVALVGGIEAMGLGGLIVGPIVMSLFVAVLRLHEKETERDAPREAVTTPPPPGVGSVS